MLIKNKRPKLNTRDDSIRETFYLMVFIFSHPKYYKYALTIFLICSFDSDDRKSSKRRVTLLNKHGAIFLEARTRPPWSTLLPFLCNGGKPE